MRLEISQFQLRAQKERTQNIHKEIRVFRRKQYGMQITECKCIFRVNIYLLFQDWEDPIFDARHVPMTNKDGEPLKGNKIDNFD